MPVEERRARMARMRQGVREHNIYRWAGLLLSELERIPEPALGVAETATSEPPESSPDPGSADDVGSVGSDAAESAAPDEVRDMRE